MASLGQEHDRRNITVATDIWAFGLTAVEVRYLVPYHPRINVDSTLFSRSSVD